MNVGNCAFADDVIFANNEEGFQQNINKWNSNSEEDINKIT